ncbi:hypothetical protein H4S06_005420 [Coemansia sp. BCRC 34490]|nr:hypothetical protein H4S06_005420 [Coemansia sp. BCRC 34490]
MVSSDTESVDNKRKRQDSIKGTPTATAAAAGAGAGAGGEEKGPQEGGSVEGNTITTTTTTTQTSVSATPEPESSASTQQQQQQQQQQASSPAKRPRTSEEGDDDVVHSPREEAVEEPAEKAVEQAEATSSTPQKKEEQKAPAPSTAAVFGTKFSSGLGFGSASINGASTTLANKPSPFASYTGITSGFAKYASETQQQQPSGAAGGGADEPSVPKSPLAASAAAAAASLAAAAADKDDGLASGTAGGKTFEDLLTAEGKETLATNVALSTVVPAMAHANVSSADGTTPPIRTYEEDETCIFSTKAKLFELAGDAWKERGAGNFKINWHNDDNNRRRMVMRTDQTFRLILNVSLFPGLQASCERRFVRFTNIDPVTKALVTFALRLASEDLAASVSAAINKYVPVAAPGVLAGKGQDASDGGASGSSGDEESASDDSEGEDEGEENEEEGEEAEEDEEEDDSSDSASQGDDADDSDDDSSQDGSDQREEPDAEDEKPRTRTRAKTRAAASSK